MAMTTRSELRAQERAQEGPAVKKQPGEAVKQGHHIRFRVWGMILLTVLMLMMLIDTTLLNKNFVKQEIDNSSLESVMLAQVNSTLTSYGIPTSVLQKSTTNKIINQAVDQVYSGQKINLDLSPVVGSVDSSVNSELSQFGVSTSMLPAGSVSAATGDINAAVNKQLNTSAVAELTSGIQIAKVVVNVVLLANLVFLLIMLLKSLWQHHLVASFSWIFLSTAVLFTLIVNAIRAVASQAGSQVPDISPFIAQVAEDFQQRGMTYTFFLTGLAIILFGIRLIKRIWRPNQ